MVWIHGGGWCTGSAFMYNGSALAIFGDVVVVSITYRLNLLGFGFGNFGLFDQLEALKWVQGLYISLLFVLYVRKSWTSGSLFFIFTMRAGPISYPIKKLLLKIIIRLILGIVCF